MSWSKKSRGFVLWFTGMSGAGKSSLSGPIAERLARAGVPVELLDGDEVRTHLSKGLGFSKEDRDVNVRRIGFVAELLAKHGVVAITAAISPYREVRDEVRGKVERTGAGFVEVHVHCPVEVLAARDVKGLYKKALAGEIPHFTGVSDPYEPPLWPEISIDSSKEPLAGSIDKIVRELAQRGLVGEGV